MLWIDQLEDYQDELVKLEDEINFEDREERRRELQARRDEIINVLSRDKEDRRFYFNY
jgi:RNAse (barnase) inhibitor barstar